MTSRRKNRPPAQQERTRSCREQPRVSKPDRDSTFHQRGIGLPATMPTWNILFPAGAGRLHRSLTRVVRRWCSANLTIRMSARRVPGFTRADLLPLNHSRALHRLGGLGRADPVCRWNLPTRLGTDILHRSRTRILLRFGLYLADPMPERHILI